MEKVVLSLYISMLVLAMIIVVLICSIVYTNERDNRYVRERIEFNQSVIQNLEEWGTNMITQEELNLRIVPNATKYLLIFPNKQLLEFYKRWLQRDDIIYMTEREIENHRLVGLTYINWCYVDELTTKQVINKKFQKNKEQVAERYNNGRRSNRNINKNDDWGRF